MKSMTPQGKMCCDFYDPISSQRQGLSQCFQTSSEAWSQFSGFEKSEIVKKTYHCGRPKNSLGLLCGILKIMTNILKQGLIIEKCLHLKEKVGDGPHITFF